MEDTITRMFVEEKVQEDFKKFSGADCVREYYKTKHISMATQIVLNCIELGDYVSIIDINDLVHGLNHIFFNGATAGVDTEWAKEAKRRANES